MKLRYLFLIVGLGVGGYLAYKTYDKYSRANSLREQTLPHYRPLSASHAFWEVIADLEDEVHTPGLITDFVYPPDKYLR